MSDDPLPIRPDDPTVHLSGHLPPPSSGRRWRQFDRLVVVVFCLGLLVPGLLLVARIRPPAIENRPLLTAPPATLGSLLDAGWYSKVDRFIADNVAVRPVAVALRGQAYWLSGGTGNPAVVRGTGGWLFTVQEIRVQCDLGVADISAALDRTDAAFTAAGQDFRFVLAPDKHVIYPEKLDPGMPYGPACTDDRRAAMKAVLDERSGFAIDGWAEVLAERAAHPDGPLLYYVEDTHWTPSGAVPAMRALITSLGPDLWRDDDVAIGPPIRASADLARQMGLIRHDTIPSVILRPTVQIVRTAMDLPVQTTGAPAVYRITATGDRPLVPGVTVIAYDSFFGRNMAVLSRFFADSIWIHISDLKNHPEIATLIGPVDRVIMDRVERGLYITQIDDLLRPLVRTGP
jgi:SGNH hydrolase-like domain, acetyltransferase AlgX